MIEGLWLLGTVILIAAALRFLFKNPATGYQGNALVQGAGNTVGTFETLAFS